MPEEMTNGVIPATMDELWEVTHRNREGRSESGANLVWECRRWGYLVL